MIADGRSTRMRQSLNARDVGLLLSLETTGGASGCHMLQAAFSSGSSGGKALKGGDRRRAKVGNALTNESGERPRRTMISLVDSFRLAG